MEHANLNTALTDLVDGIRGAFLGSVENVVIQDAGKSLIQSWNDHNADDPIDEVKELANWEKLCENDLH